MPVWRLNCCGASAGDENDGDEDGRDDDDDDDDDDDGADDDNHQDHVCHSIGGFLRQRLGFVHFNQFMPQCPLGGWPKSASVRLASLWLRYVSYSLGWAGFGLVTLAWVIPPKSNQAPRLG